ncbi:hypothetical protein Vadar_024762 [Vaccinium darrowii]|uniref:Uncharacterized protein n=1 Tax=Vaccinium darrowii TaxID=229202 RepID=A0ACB7YP84_9ERIC|nr:hypothetical protein Vadar_024762 [Vaccinium darrowii]
MQQSAACVGRETSVVPFTVTLASSPFSLLTFFTVSGIQNLSLSVQITPKKYGWSNGASRSLELLQVFLKSGPKEGPFRNLF